MTARHWLYICVNVIPLVLIFLLLTQRSKQNQKAKERYNIKTANRDRMTFKEFAHKYFPKYNPSIVCLILEEIGNWTVVEMDKLDPADHLVEDLTIGKWDGLEPNHILAGISDYYKIKMDESFLSTCSGELGDFIEKCYIEITRNKD